ncbi:MAG: PHP domain-containing protein [Christensenellaceae bacterium]|jgi:predicted metal-dependent phosphoesterase TrpH|nr:PHP domain-containing protein [Christensenellaceae bacterium]
MIDLHIHSSHSDGDYEVNELISKIHSAGITVFSITDHDEFRACVEILNNNLVPQGMKFVTGIEFSTIHNNKKMHILGYGFDIKNKQFVQRVARLREMRKERVSKLLVFLKQEFGIVIEDKEINNILKVRPCIGKPHIAHILIQKGLVSSVKEAFDKYLKKFSMSEMKIKAVEAIQIIKQAKGFAFVAHPKEIMYDYNLTYSQIDSIIRELAAKGLDGIEAYYNTHTEKDIKEFLQIADKYNLLVSCGSDFHGEKTKPNIKLSSVGKEGLTEKEVTLINKLK